MGHVDNGDIFQRNGRDIGMPIACSSGDRSLSKLARTANKG